VYEHKLKFLSVITKHKELHNTHLFYEMTPSEQQTEIWKKIKFIDENYPEMWQEKGLH